MATRHPERYERFLVQLRAARREAGLTQVQVAQTLGMPQQHVSRIELGERRLDVVELQEFARLYDKPIAFFLPES